MKVINGKRPAKRPSIKSNSPLTSVTAVSDSSVKVLALECWRISKLLPQCENRREQFMLQTSVEKMIAALAASGISIQDPEGTEFEDGMTLNIAVFDLSDRFEVGKRVVTETLSPHIYINNKLAHVARVIVSVGARDSSPGA